MLYQRCKLHIQCHDESSNLVLLSNVHTATDQRPEGTLFEFGLPPPFNRFVYFGDLFFAQAKGARISSLSVDVFAQLYTSLFASTALDHRQITILSVPLNCQIADADADSECENESEEEENGSDVAEEDEEWDDAEGPLFTDDAGTLV